jgi:hypothetical protein
VDVDLKIWRAQYAAVRDGSKTFEYRKEDRHQFRVGDVLLLREYNEDSGQYVDYYRRVLRRRVTYVLRHGFGLPAGHVVLGLGKAPRRARSK